MVYHRLTHPIKGKMRKIDRTSRLRSPSGAKRRTHSIHAAAPIHAHESRSTDAALRFACD